MTIFEKHYFICISDSFHFVGIPMDRLTFRQHILLEYSKILVIVFRINGHTRHNIKNLKAWRLLEVETVRY